MIQVHTTKQWLADRHINVPDDWLQACVDWLQEENPGQLLVQDSVNKQVYEQWLLSDLHELETQCLPAEVSSAEKFDLNGKYALQIDSILDVGKSFYSQQQKYKGTENANTKVSADEQEVKPWEMKPTRMLMMTLTDGRQTVKGMEYKPISSLSPQTHPGAKILVNGSVLYRHGILMLSEGTIKCLGGEVDTLMEENTILNNLQTAMDASVEHAEKNYRQEFRGSEITHSQKPRPSQLQQQQQQQYQRPLQGGRQGPSSGFKQEPYSQKYQPMKTEIQSQKSNVVTKTNQPRNNTVEDAWDDDDADLMDAFMDDMDDFDSPTSQTPGTSANRNNSSAHNSAGTSHGVIGSRNFTSNTALTGLGVNRSNNTRSRTSSSSSVGQNQTINRNKNQSSITNFTSASSVTNNNLGINRNNRTSSSNKQSLLTSEDLCDDIEFEDEIDFPLMEEDDFDIPHSKPKHQKQSELTKSSEKSRTQNEFQRASCVLNTDQFPNRLGKINGNNESNASRSTGGGIVKKEQAGSIKNITQPPTVRSKQSSTPAAIKQERETETKSDDNSYVTTEYPYTYLSKMMSLPKLEEPVIHTVKAFISTLTSRLATDTGKWSLACKINDGTMAIEVDISDKVLTDMIGFSYEQSKVLRVEAARNPKVKEKLKKGIQDFQQKLVNLMCLLEVELSSTYTRPVVVATRPITTNHVNMLYNRVLGHIAKFKQQ